MVGPFGKTWSYRPPGRNCVGRRQSHRAGSGRSLAAIALLGEGPKGVVAALAGTVAEELSGGTKSHLCPWHDPYSWLILIEDHGAIRTSTAEAMNSGRPD